MNEFTYRTIGVCAREITVRIENGILTGVSFLGGCDGNTQAVSRLAVGMPVREVIRRLKGIDCEGMGTSCPDQLSIILEKVLEELGESIA